MFDAILSGDFAGYVHEKKLKAVRDTVVALLTFALAFLLFAYVADFSATQSVMLSVLVLWLFFNSNALHQTTSKVEPPFSPYWVSIRPKWEAILHDHGVVLDGESMRKAREKAKGRHSVLHDGFNFMRLTRKLFYWSDYQTFKAELSFRCIIFELAKEPEEGQPRWDVPFTPQVYIKSTFWAEKQLPSMELGLRTAESMKKGIGWNPSDSDIGVPLAWLPDAVFFGYLNANAYYRDSIKINEQINEVLKDCGWVREPRGDSEVRFRHANLIHKYFEVSYGEV